MEIDRISQQPSRRTESVSEQAGVPRAEHGKRHPHAERAERASGDTLEISDRARELARAHEAVESAPDVRAEKVARIKQQVESGTYSVPAEELAKKLLGGS
jgi:negative regulator of flagellin synthesis FlgM